jgi:hypothetical protein
MEERQVESRKDTENMPFIDRLKVYALYVNGKYETAPYIQ